MLKPIKGQPGRFLETDSGQVLNIAEYREDDKYDTIFIPGGGVRMGPGTVLPFGTRFTFFRDILTKHQIDTNFTLQSRVSAGEEMIIDRIGIYPHHLISGNKQEYNSVEGPPAIPPNILAADIIRIIENGYFRVDVNSQLLAEGPMFKFASGYGISGHSHHQNCLGVGTPSNVAAAKLVKTQILTKRHEILGYLIFHDHDWILDETDCPVSEIVPIYIATIPGILVTAFLHGLIKSAVSK